MFNHFKKGDKVTGRYMGTEFAGTVRSVSLNELTRNDRIEIDFPAPIIFRGGERSGLLLTNLGERDILVKA